MSPRLLRPRAAAATGFTPRSIADLGLWLDASATSSLTLNGNNVSEWRDLSGNARHYSQSSASAQPSGTAMTHNGLRVIDFDASNGQQLLGNAASLAATRNVSGLTVFAACKFDATIDPQPRPLVFFQGGGAGTRFAFGVVNVPSLYGRRLDADSVVFVSAPDFITNPSVFTAIADYANSDAFLYSGGSLLASNTSFQTNGNTSDTDSLASAIGSNAGATNVWDGWAGEIVVYRRALSVSERQSVERYLGAKWGITVT